VTRHKQIPPSSDAPVPEMEPHGEVLEAVPAETGRPRLARLRLGRMKWVYIVVFGLISLGLTLKLTYPLLGIHLDLWGHSNKGNMNVRPEDYEPISPFFVPMASSRDKVAARVDIRVKWDRLTGARFMRDKIVIRQKIYLYLRELQRWSEDMEANRHILEEGIGGILRQTLGVKDVDVLVEDIHYIQIEALSLRTLACTREKESQNLDVNALPVKLRSRVAKYLKVSDPAVSRDSDFRFIRIKGVCSWMNFPMSATPCWGSVPPTRWWG
jgi:hypothetical protein